MSQISFKLVGLAFIFWAAPVWAGETPAVLGWLENVQLHGLAEPLPAKLDSGADHSSLHAQAIDILRLNQEPWVRFQSVAGQTLHARLVRESRIKQKNAASQARPVVQLTLCLNGRWREIDANLVDRSGFKQALLIGRSALLPGELIDVHQTHLSRPGCASLSKAALIDSELPN